MSMHASAIVAEAWISMGATRMRSFLTMLGIIIGVASVVLMLAIGQGVQNQIQQSIATMGSNLFIVLSGSTTSGGIRMGSGSRQTLTLSDAREIAALEDVAGAAPVVSGGSQMVYGANNWSTAVMGTTPEFLNVREWRVEQGLNFGDADQRSASRVALIGITVRDSLFGENEDPVGKIIRIKNIPFEVIGVLESKGQSLEGRDQDDTVIVPLSTAVRQLFGTPFPDSVRYIMVKAASTQSMDRLEERMTSLLRDRHRIGNEADNDFTIRNLAAVAESAEDSGKAMSILLGSIASISLLVGGIGIMNIMLVSVTERTREIGIRKAIGSQEGDILLQFLLEAVLISLAGGCVGMLLGIGGAYLLTAFVDIETQVSVTSIALSFAVSTAVGVFFGYYPAHQAARLRPIEALRYQ